MSLLRRAFRTIGLRIGKDKYLAGTDLEGNSFYERPHPEYPDEWRKNKRTVEYKVTRYLSDYNYETIPVQWSSWLRRTRRQPPTLQELETDYYRQLRLQDNVAKLEVAYREERMRIEDRNRDALALPNTVGSDLEKMPNEVEGEDQQVGVLQKEGTFDEGLPNRDTGIGAKEAKIGKNIGVKDVEGSTTSTSEPTKVKAEDAEQVAKERREAEREAAKQRREEFARNAPPTGNPSDSFQPQAWSPAGPARRR